MTNIKYSVAFKTKEGDHISRQTMTVEEYIDFLHSVVLYQDGRLKPADFNRDYPSHHFSTEKRMEVCSYE